MILCTLRLYCQLTLSFFRTLSGTSGDQIKKFQSHCKKLRSSCCLLECYCSFYCISFKVTACIHAVHVPSRSFENFYWRSSLGNNKKKVGCKAFSTLSLIWYSMQCKSQFIFFQSPCHDLLLSFFCIGSIFKIVDSRMKQNEAGYWFLPFCRFSKKIS